RLRRQRVEIWSSGFSLRDVRKTSRTKVRPYHCSSISPPEGGTPCFQQGLLSEINPPRRERIMAKTCGSIYPDVPSNEAGMNTPRLPGKIRIASPCHARWEDMGGDERVRFCDHCGKNVYNLSALTAAQGAALIEAKEGRLCARFH